MAEHHFYSKSEIDALERLPITIPPYQRSGPNSEKRSSPPFSEGQKIEKYTREDLKKKTNRKGERTDFFEKTLYGIWAAIRRPVPYAFREADGTLRSLDAGCLGFLVNKGSPDLHTSLDPETFIVAVKPTDCLIERYQVLEQRLIDRVLPPQKHFAEPRPSPIVSFLTEPQVLPLLESPTILDDIEAAAPELAKVSETERDTLIKARLGQGRFRAELINYWGGCAVLGDLPTNFLLASHIKPWRASNNQERLDPYNGLLLSPNLNHIFDQGFISFDHDGKVLLSCAIDNESAARLYLNDGLRLRKLESRHLIYLTWHQTNVFRRYITTAELKHITTP